MSKGATPDWLRPHLPNDLIPADWRDYKQLGDITADAFQNDPLNTWMFGNINAMRAVFQSLAKHVYGKRGFCHRIGDEAAAMWLGPGGSTALPNVGAPRFASSVIRHGGMSAFKRALAFDKTASLKHPKEPHAYLFTIGVRQGLQGKGLGKRLLAPVLKACDAAGLPTYLENSNPNNHGFYRSFGFETTEKIHPITGSPILELMWRDPKPQGPKE